MFAESARTSTFEICIYKMDLALNAKFVLDDARCKTNYHTESIVWKKSDKIQLGYFTRLQEQPLHSHSLKKMGTHNFKTSYDYFPQFTFRTFLHPVRLRGARYVKLNTAMLADKEHSFPSTNRIKRKFPFSCCLIYKEARNVTTVILQIKDTGSSRIKLDNRL
jgi:hypothetical protein